MREAFPPSLPSGSPDLENSHYKPTVQQSTHKLDAPKTIVFSEGTSIKKDASFGENLKSKKTTTKQGHSPHHHLNSTSNTKWNTGSTTFKSESKTLERGMYSRTVKFSKFQL